MAERTFKRGEIYWINLETEKSEPRLQTVNRNRKALKGYF